jgi:hypothetical protein
VRFEDFLPGVRQADLADRGRGLAFLELELAGREAELTASECDRARGDDHHFLAATAQRREVLGERLEPRAVEATRRAFDEQGRPDLDDDPPRPAET